MERAQGDSTVGPLPGGHLRRQLNKHQTRSVGDIWNTHGPGWFGSDQPPSLQQGAIVSNLCSTATYLLYRTSCTVQYPPFLAVA